MFVTTMLYASPPDREAHHLAQHGGHGPVAQLLEKLRALHRARVLELQGHVDDARVASLRIVLVDRQAGDEVRHPVAGLSALIGAAHADRHQGAEVESLETHAAGEEEPARRTHDRRKDHVVHRPAQAALHGLHVVEVQPKPVETPVRAYARIERGGRRRDAAGRERLEDAAGALPGCAQ